MIGKLVISVALAAAGTWVASRPLSPKEKKLARRSLLVYLPRAAAMAVCLALALRPWLMA